MEKFTSYYIIKNMILMTTIGVILGFLSPFGMMDVPQYITILYWVNTCIVGFFIYAPIIHLAESKLASTLQQKWHRIAIGAFIASVLMTAIVPLLSHIYFDYQVSLLGEFFALFPRTLMIGGLITFVSLIKDKLDKQKVALSETEKTLNEIKENAQDSQKAIQEDFLKQIPLEKRGELLCLEMSDHYIKVYTSKGHHMILMRFKDALNTLSAFSGFQTHRSWWVAQQAIEKVEKEERKLKLKLSNGVSVPVSKTYVNNVKNAGLI